MEPKEIKKLLETKGWTRTQLAEETGVSLNTVHQWLSGRRCPGSSAVFLMQRILAEKVKS